MLFLDSAVLQEAQEAARLPFVGGVTCNPTLLARALGSAKVTPERVADHLAALSEAHPGVHYVQTLSQDLDGIIRDAHRYLEVFHPSRLVVKIPYSHHGLSAVRRLEGEGIRTCVTAVTSPLQTYVAAISGASWVAPYCNRITVAGGDGVAAVKTMLEILERNHLGCRLLVASVKSLDEMEALAVQGAHRITVPLAILREVLIRPLTETALRDFRKSLAWEGEVLPMSDDEISRGWGER